MQVQQPNNMGMPPQQDHQVQSQLRQQFQQFQKQNISHFHAGKITTFYFNDRKVRVT